MSQDEIRQQAERITAIDANVVDVAVAIKTMKNWWPYLCGFFTLIGAVIGATVTVYVWNQSLVKQDQFSRHELREIKRDSILNAKIDTNNLRINTKVDAYNVHVNSRIDRIVIPNYRIANRDRNGNLTYRNVN